MRLPKRFVPHPLTKLALACAAVACAVPALARDADSRLPDAVRRVERETNGQVLRAEQMRDGTQRVPRLKVLTPDGRVRVVREDRRGSPPTVHPAPHPDQRSLLRASATSRRDAGRSDTSIPLRDDGQRRQD